jgi:hypothetical protein
VVPVVAVHGAQVPWGKVVMDGVPVEDVLQGCHAREPRFDETDRVGRDL